MPTQRPSHLAHEAPGPLLSLLMLGGTVYALAVLGALLNLGPAPERSPQAQGVGTPSPIAGGSPPDRPSPAVPESWRQAAEPVSPPPSPVSSPDRLRLGFAMNLHYTEQLGEYRLGIDRLAQAGFDHLLILTPMFQKHGGSQDIRLLRGPGRGPEAWQLTNLLSHAQRRGLDTFLMPIVLFTEPRGNEWRGKIQPDNWDTWWASYRELIRIYLGIAQRHGVDGFVIGSELLSTEGHTRRWRELIAQARQRYSGLLTYSTNWDHYHNPRFWDDLDLIGMNAYHNLAPDGDASVPAMAQRWRDIRRNLAEFARQQGRPILITEMGYPSLPWAASKPWNYIAEDGLAPDHQAQARAYRAFLHAWEPLIHARTEANPTFYGVTFYKWDPYHRGGPEDTGYGVRGKPAWELLRQSLPLKD